MYQKLMILAIILLGLASCSVPKKATYVEPVISAKPLETETDKVTLSKVVDEYSVPKSFVVIR